MLQNSFCIALVRTVNRSGSLKSVKQPGAANACICKGFQGSESLGSNDEQSSLRVESLEFLSSIIGIDVRNVTSRNSGILIRLKSFINHYRTQIRTADADVYNSLNLLAGNACPFAGTNLVCESVNALENFANILNSILTVNDILALVGSRTAQCSMKHGAILSIVDVNACVLLLNTLVKLDIFRQRSQKLQGLRLNQIL